MRAAGSSTSVQLIELVANEGSLGHERDADKGVHRARQEPVVARVLHRRLEVL